MHSARSGELHSALLEVLMSRGKVAPFYSAQLAVAAKEETVRDAIRAAGAAAGGEADGQAAPYWADGQAAASGKASAAAEATQLAGVVRMHGERLDWRALAC